MNIFELLFFVSILSVVSIATCYLEKYTGNGIVFTALVVSTGFVVSAMGVGSIVAMIKGTHDDDSAQ